MAPVTEPQFLRKLELLQSAGKAAKGDAHKKVRPGLANPLKAEKNIETTTNGMRFSELPFDPTICVFDESRHATPDANLTHMEEKYKFFIPERSYVANVEGLLSVLWQKINVDHQCMYCFKRFTSYGAVRNHITDMNHFLIGFDAGALDDVYHQFYDFSTSHKELGCTVLDPEADDEWEDLSDDEGIDGQAGDDTWDPVFAGMGLKAARVNEAGFLVTPTGQEVAPRELAYVFKQNIRPVQRLQHEAREVRCLLDRQSGAVSTRDKQHVRFQKVCQADKQVQRAFWRMSKADVRLGVKANQLHRTIKRDNLIII
eukprot:Lankesteria_metandrocarpae@DN4221_c0_g1_i1.p1